jgi:hypothetical protein
LTDSGGIFTLKGAILGSNLTPNGSPFFGEELMAIINEKQQLNEMALLVISSRKDDLPFRIVIKSPDHQPPHAHIMDLKTGKIELGQFEISKNFPRSPKDIKNYKKGISDETREIIFKWAGRPYRDLPKNSNWEMLCSVWDMNEKW